MARGEGVIGLSRAFSYAGAARLLVSLWPVWDVTTQGLMVDFYGGLLGGSGESSALRAAKLSLIGGEARYAMPYFWAPFILVGQ